MPQLQVGRLGYGGEDIGQGVGRDEHLAQSHLLQQTQTGKLEEVGEIILTEIESFQLRVFRREEIFKQLILLCVSHTGLANIYVFNLSQSFGHKVLWKTGDIYIIHH